MTADDEVKTAGRERELLGVSLLQPDRDPAFRRLAPRLGEHRGREVNAGDVMAAGRELEREEPGAATGVKRVKRASAREDKSEDAVPGSALGGGADAVSEVLVEVGRPPIPMSGDLLLGDVSHPRRQTASDDRPASVLRILGSRNPTSRPAPERP